MGLFSFLKCKAAPKIPSIEEQQEQACRILDNFLSFAGAEIDSSEKGECEVAYFSIAGLTFRCDLSDVGMFTGFTYLDKSNVKDKKAIAIISVDKNGKQRHLGFIAKRDQKKHNDFTEGDQYPCIGYIKKFQKKDEDGNFEGWGISGTVKIYKGSGKRVLDVMTKDIKNLNGWFKGYDGEQTLEEQGEKLDWMLERHF